MRAIGARVNRSPIIAAIAAAVLVVACAGATSGRGDAPSSATVGPIRPTGAATATFPTPTAAAIAYVPPSAAKTAQAQFARTPHPSPTATVVPTATPIGAKVSFAAVQQLLTGNCAGCHPPNQGLDLTTGHVYANLVSVPSHEVPSLLRVKPGDPAASYLYQKVSQANPRVGVRMPKDGVPLSADELTTLRVWIEQGASGR